jgi:uncharacterized protein DUF2806
MEAPGEKLLTKLWESIADKGIASLLKPWQMRTEGRAAIDLRRDEMLTLAQAEREVEAIRRGEKALLPNGEIVALPMPSVQTVVQIEAEPPQLAIPYIAKIAERNAKADDVRKEIALAKAVLHAEDELKTDSESPSDDPLSDDWLLRWRDCAANVSSDDLQSIWGKVLAGEIKSPGRYSLRTLDFLKNLSQQEAETIEKISPFVVSGVIFRSKNSVLEDEGINFGYLLAMQELGVLAGVDAQGLQIQLKSSSTTSYEKALFCHGKLLLIKASDPAKVLSLDIYSVTAIGKQVLRLGTFQPNEKMLLAMADAIKGMGFQVELGNYVSVGNQIQSFDLQPL